MFEKMWNISVVRSFNLCLQVSSEKKVLKTRATWWIAPVHTVYWVGFGRRKTDTLHCPWLHHSVLCSIHFTAERGTALRRWKAPSISLIVWQGQFISARSPSSDRNQLTHCLAYPTQGGSLQLLQLSAFFPEPYFFFFFFWNYDFFFHFTFDETMSL